mmetsp:Transcript_21808/g.51221  ORF Transcript_21808/g.51221 Transcript_21808/m.51221 type:complete len:214 (-) Transcript_21808:691-1332(-)
MITSPGKILPLRCSTWNRTACCIDPRCTGTCGALATRPPVGSNNAQLKSSRSLMFVLIAVRCRVRPICSAIDMNRCPNTLSAMGSAVFDSRLFAGPASGSSPTVISMSESAVRRAVQKGSTTMVQSLSKIIAGPSTTMPGVRASLFQHAVSRRPPAKKTGQDSSGAGGSTGGRIAEPTPPPGTTTRSCLATTRTRTSSRMSRAVGSVKPNSRL